VLEVCVAKDKICNIIR